MGKINKNPAWREVAYCNRFQPTRLSLGDDNEDETDGDRHALHVHAHCKNIRGSCQRLPQRWLSVYLHGYSISMPLWRLSAFLSLFQKRRLCVL